MTPAQLDALTDVHVRIHEGKSGRHSKPKPSANPAADLAALAAMQ